MPAPGLLYVNGRFTDPNLTVEAYDKWYDEVHIPHILTMSGCDTASRYTDIDKNSREPYLTLYPLKDVDWIHSDEFGQVTESLEAEYLPQRNAAKSVEFDARAYTLLDSVEGVGAKSGPAQFVILTEIAHKSGRSSPSSVSSSGSSDSVVLGDLGALGFRAGFKRARRYYLHDGQPEFWKQRWREGERWQGSGGWPVQDLLIQEFDGSLSAADVRGTASDTDAAERSHGQMLATSKVYRFTSAHE